MDIDAFTAAHAPEWERLEQVLATARRPGRLRGEEVDELVVLYQRTATHLSQVRASAPDPLLVARLSALVARARGAVAGTRPGGLAPVSRFFTVGFPAALYRTRRWSLSVAAVSVVLAGALGAWIANDPSVRDRLAPPGTVASLVNSDFKNYYSAHSAQSFAGHVWTNNLLVAAMALAFGILIVPVLLVLGGNIVNVAVDGGLLFAYGKGGEFFALILPHGMLELSAVFIACGAGLRLGWTWVDPGPRRRADALAEEGRTTLTLAGGLALVLAVSGVLEAFLTPSPLPTWARIGIGGGVEAAFVAYAGLLGRRAVRLGDLGDVAEGAGDRAATA